MIALLGSIEAYPTFELRLESSLTSEVLVRIRYDSQPLQTPSCLLCESNDVFDMNGSRIKRCSRTAALPGSKVLVLVVFHDLLQRPLFLNVHAITCLLFCTIPIVNHLDSRTRDHGLKGFASIDLGGGKLRSCVF